MNPAAARRVVEAALFCAPEPLSMRELRTLLGDALATEAIEGVLVELARDCDARGIELVRVASGWRFQSRAEMREYLDRLEPPKVPRYSRAVLETLAIVAHRQPVTRADIEAIRGVAVNPLVLRQLEERGWVETVGHRETPGRPALLATTRRFLDDLGLAALDRLPASREPAEPPPPPAEAGA